MVTATQKRPVPATEVSTTTLPLCSSVAQPPPTYRSPTVENASEYEEYVERQERRQIELAEKQPDSQVHDLEAQNARLIARQQPARQPVRPVRSVGGGRVWFCHGFYISALAILMITHIYSFWKLPGYRVCNRDGLLVGDGRMVGFVTEAVGSELDSLAGMPARHDLACTPNKASKREEGVRKGLFTRCIADPFGDGGLVGIYHSWEECEVRRGLKM